MAEMQTALAVALGDTHDPELEQMGRAIQNGVEGKAEEETQ